jgi:hypothetical protein
VRHGFGDEPQTVVENVTNDHALNFPRVMPNGLRNLLSRKELVRLTEP